MEIKESASLTFETYKRLKDDIIRLNLKPGELIIVQQLANKMHISRTPVREALTMLTKDAFVEKAEGNKFRVTDITVKSITELYTIRRLLETFAVRETLNDFTQEDFDYLESNTESYRKAYEVKDYLQFFTLDNEFHHYFFKKLDNKLLYDFFEQLSDRQQRIRFATMYIYDRPGLSVQEHINILNALKRKDFAEFEKELCAHLSKVEDDMMAKVSQQRSAFTANGELSADMSIHAALIHLL